MGTVTKVEWCQRVLPDGTTVAGHTLNFWWGCVKISPGCANCYANDIAIGYGHHVWGPAQTTERWLLSLEAARKKVRSWNRQAQAEGHRHNVFLASMSDICEENSQLDPIREQVWDILEQSSWLNWLLLTKRPEHLVKMSKWGSAPWPDNIWPMTSVEQQRYTEPRLSALLAVKARVHGVSVEPQLEHIDLMPWLGKDAINWIICGGESGPDSKRRPFFVEWARSLREQCAQAEVPFYFKQHGGRYHNSNGRVLDGREWNEMPPEF